MPTLSAIELDNLVQPQVLDSCKKPLNVPPPTTPLPPPPARNHIYITPALYVTPEPAPIPETVTEPVSPSPYVVNHKRRGGGTGAFGNRKINTYKCEAPAGEQELVKGKDKEGADLVGMVEEEEEEEVAEDNFSGFAEDELFVNKDEAAEEEEGFLDTRCDSVSVGSQKDAFRLFDCRSFVSSTQGEFFDAIEDFSSESGVSNSYGQNSESELRALKLSLLEEIEKRKDAEDALTVMLYQWQVLRDLLSEVGIKLPIISRSSGGVSQLEDLSQSLTVHRYVSEALGKAEARLEAELAAEAILQSKDQEISRLRDRLQYYEAVNREMSQRNQEIIEVGRKQRQRRNTRWFWSGIGAAAAIGISLLAYTYTSKPQDLPSPGNSNTSSSQS